MTQAEPSGKTIRAILLLLTCTAGVVDATAYLQLGQVFPANMSGNTVLLALRLGGAHPGSTLGNVVALLGFCAGALLGALMLMLRERQHTMLQLMTRALTGEIVLMSIVALLWYIANESLVLPLIGLSAIAMGVQSAVAGRIGVSGVSSVAITNTLTLAMKGVVSRFHAVEAPHPQPQAALFLVVVWLVYLVGALVAAVGSSASLSLPFILPVVLLAFALVLALRMHRH